MRPLEDYNPFDPEVAENPFEYYTALREQAPVYQTPMGFFMVSTYDHCVSAIRDPGVFSSRFAAAMAGGMGGAEKLEGGELDEIPMAPTDTLLTNDPPSHTRFRKLVNKAFSPRRVEKMDDYVSTIASNLIDGFAAQSTIDAVPELAVPLPLTAFVAAALVLVRRRRSVSHAEPRATSRVVEGSASSYCGQWGTGA